MFNFEPETPLHFNLKFNLVGRLFTEIFRKDFLLRRETWAPESYKKFSSHVEPFNLTFTLGLTIALLPPKRQLSVKKT